MRTREANQPERVTVTAGVLNRTAAAAGDVPIHLEIDGRVVQDLRVSVAPNGSASVSFAPLTITAPNTRAVVRLGAAGATVDALPRDNVFNFVLTPAAPVPVMLTTPAVTFFTTGARVGMPCASSIGMPAACPVSGHAIRHTSQIRTKLRSIFMFCPRRKPMNVAPVPRFWRPANSRAIGYATLWVEDHTPLNGGSAR